MAFPDDTVYPQSSGLYPGDAIVPTPEVVTLAATATTTTTVTLNGTVDPNGISTNYLFLYGTSDGYASATGLVSAGSGSSPVAVSANLTGLTRNRYHHFELVGFVGAAPFYGGDLAFYTLASIDDPIFRRYLTAAGRGQ